MSLFQQPGSSLLVVVPNDKKPFKEVQVVLYNTDVQAFYAKHDSVGPKTLLVALERAGRRLNVGGQHGAETRLK